MDAPFSQSLVPTPALAGLSHPQLPTLAAARVRYNGASRAFGAALPVRRWERAEQPVV